MNSLEHLDEASEEDFAESNKLQERVKDFLKEQSKLKTGVDRIIEHNIPNNPTLSPMAPPCLPKLHNKRSEKLT